MMKSEMMGIFFVLIIFPPLTDFWPIKSHPTLGRETA